MDLGGACQPGVADLTAPAEPIAALGPLPQATAIACNPAAGLRV